MSLGAVQGEDGPVVSSQPFITTRLWEMHTTGLLGKVFFSFFVRLPAKPCSYSHTFEGVNYPEPIFSSKPCERHSVSFLHFDITGNAVDL